MNSTQRIDGHEQMSRADKANPLLARVDDLELYFDTRRGTVKALDGISFDIHERETVALVGETGCGKSITARSFTHLVPTPPGRYPGGHILLKSATRTCEHCDGGGCSECYESGRAFEDILTMDQKRVHELRTKRIAMVFQDPEEALNPSLTIKTQVAESVLVHHGEEILKEAGIDPERADGLTKRILQKYASPSLSRIENVLASIPPLRKHKKQIDTIVHGRIVDILAETQIPNPEEIVANYPHELSGGQQQRVMIAMALVAEPDLLIADEPTTALDVTIQTKILKMMENLQESFDTSFLYITHDLSLVKDIADKVIVMYGGQVAETANVEDLYANPLHPYTNGLLESIPTVEKMGEDLTGIPGSVPDMTNPPEGCRFCTRCPEELEHCKTVDPLLVEKEQNHHVACHLYPPGEERTDDTAKRATEGMTNE